MRVFPVLASPEWLFSDLWSKSWLWSHMKQKRLTHLSLTNALRHIEQFLQCQSWRNWRNLSVPSHIWNIISVHLDEGNTLDYNELQPGSLTLLSMSNLTLLALLQWCVLCRLLGPDKTCKFNMICAKRPVVGLNCGDTLVAAWLT